MATQSRFDLIVYAVQQSDPTIAASLIFEAAQNLIDESCDPEATRHWLKTASIADVAAVLIEQF